MSQQTAALLLGIPALLVLVPAVRGLRRARAFGDWDLTSTLVFLVGLFASLPTVLPVAFSSPVERVDLYGNLNQTLPNWSRQVGYVGDLALLAMSLLFILHRILRRRTALPTVNPAPLIALLLCVTVGVSDALNGHQAVARGQLVLLAVLLAATVARPGRAAFLGAAGVGLVLAVSGGLLALIRPTSVFRDCRIDKCDVLGSLYQGVFVNENTYGLLLALSVPFIWLALRGRLRLVLASYVAAMAFATGSRTAQAAAGVCLLSLILLRPALAEGRTTRPVARARAWLPAPAVLGMCAVAITAFAVPFANRSPEALGQRQYYWNVAIDQFSGSPFYGLGGKAWDALNASGQTDLGAIYSVHNQWIDVLYAGGIIALLLYVALLLTVIKRGGNVAACVIIPVLVASALDRPWNFSSLDWLSYTLVAATLMPHSLVSGPHIRPASDPSRAKRSSTERVVQP